MIVIFHWGFKVIYAKDYSLHFALCTCGPDEFLNQSTIIKFLTYEDEPYVCVKYNFMRKFQIDFFLKIGITILS